VIYARSSDRPDRCATYPNSIRHWAAEAGRDFRDSAAETGGDRHIRFIHNAGCVLTVPNVVMSPTGDDSFTNTQIELAAAGYNLADRKYMVYVDANVYCGIGDIRNDDSAGAGNLNNGGPSYGRTDAGCWGGPTAAHELMHNIGGVQLSAPQSSGGGHCIDEWDLECYSDSPYFPTMIYLCPTERTIGSSTAGTTTTTAPASRPASWRRTGMRPTASTWSSSRTPVWGYVWANNPTAGSYTPSTTYQRNLTRTLATNTITRSGVGYYKVVFENLGIYSGGTIDVTAYGPGPGECKVQNWGPTLADMNVYVRCFNANGAALDTMFTAALTRPISSSRFGYVWANSPSSASYTPSTTYQYNSTFATNTITRLGAGTYRVRLPAWAA
jgi:hypothetical protein